MINNTSDVSVVGGILRVDEGIDKRVYVFMGCPLTKSKPLKEKIILTTANLFLYRS